MAAMAAAVVAADGGEEVGGGVGEAARLAGVAVAAFAAGVAGGFFGPSFAMSAYVLRVEHTRHMCLPVQLCVEHDEHCQDSAETFHAGGMEGGAQRLAAGHCPKQ
jgi:hypothetical protein